MEYEDLGGFLTLLERKGELIHIQESVNWDVELGSISQESINRNGPAFICENIKDHERTTCKKLAMNYLGNWRRVALALGVAEDTTPSDMVREWRKRHSQLIKPVVVDSGPCKENTR